MSARFSAGYRAFRRDEARTPIAFTDMDFLVRGFENSRVRIEAEVQLTNQGDGPNPDLVVEIKAREADARLLADRQWTMVGAIRPGATVTRNVTLSVPDQHNHEVEAVLWSGDVIVERSSRSVNLAPNTTVPGGTAFTVRRIATGEFVTARETGGPVPVPVRRPGPRASAGRRCSRGSPSSSSRGGGTMTHAFPGGTRARVPRSTSGPEERRRESRGSLLAFVVTGLAGIVLIFVLVASMQLYFAVPETIRYWVADQYVPLVNGAFYLLVIVGGVYLVLRLLRRGS